MAYEIVWLPKAAKRYDEIIEWLRENWSDKEITNFIVRTKDVLELISTNPALYRRSEKENVHEAIVTKHNILLYRKKKNKVELMTFFDTRQNPSKKYKKTLRCFRCAGRNRSQTFITKFNAAICRKKATFPAVRFFVN